MKRRSFIKGVAAAGAFLPATSAIAFLESCSSEKEGAGWDFDELVDRSGTWSIKYSRADGDKIPMWIADMDFKTDPYVAKALKDRLSRDVMGYTSTPSELYEAVWGFEKREHAYDLEKDWIGYAPGVITSLNQAYLCFTSPGDKIIVQPPVYDHFKMYIERLGRECVDNPLIFEGGKYRMDFEGLEKLFDSKTKALVLCNPHNPIGIEWDKETLSRLAAICRSHGVLIFSDEIHSPLSLFGHRHNTFTSVGEDAAAVGLVFAGPTKAYNLAGLSGTAYCIIPEENKRKEYLSYLSDRKLSEPSIPTIVSTIASYTSPTGWLPSLKTYLEGNVEEVMKFFDEKKLGIVPFRPEASFLVWLDCTKLPMEDEELIPFFRDKAGVVLSSGSSYGPGGEGHLRMNVGCPRSVLRKALDRIASSLG